MGSRHARSSQLEEMINDLTASLGKAQQLAASTEVSKTVHGLESPEREGTRVGQAAEGH